eukprot:m.25956 g.25956  ORF g.25956 m.25956 type:complete len:266 (-) comp5811_c0_seq1:480-1277(-)
MSGEKTLRLLWSEIFNVRILELAEPFGGGGYQYTKDSLREAGRFWFKCGWFQYRTSVAATTPSLPPKTRTPQTEIVFMGASNAGKSTLTNAMFEKKNGVRGAKKLARTSATPGHTKLLNFFDCDSGEIRVVDVPGYGFRSEITHVQLLRKYFRQRKFGDVNGNASQISLQSNCGVSAASGVNVVACLLISATRGIKEVDLNYLKFLVHDVGISTQIVMTKADKLKAEDLRMKILECEEIVHKELHSSSQSLHKDKLTYFRIHPCT